MQKEVFYLEITPKEENLFPNYFNDTVIAEILKLGKKTKKAVYRYGKSGKNIKDAYICSYGEVLFDIKIPMPKRKEKWLKQYRNKVEQFSTSCYENVEDIKYHLDTVLKNNPHCIILYGETSPDDGLSQLTKERDKDRTDSHVDWWLYDNADPSIYFKEIEVAKK